MSAAAGSGKPPWLHQASQTEQQGYKYKIVSGGRYLYCFFLFVCLFFLGTCTTELVWQAHDGKVFSLTWTTVVLREAPGATIPLNLLFSCGPGGELVSLHLINFKTHSECFFLYICMFVCLFVVCCFPFTFLFVCFCLFVFGVCIGLLECAL